MKLTEAQSTRLVSLLKGAAGGQMAESEKAELTFLSGIAAQSGELTDLVILAGKPETPAAKEEPETPTETPPAKPEASASAAKPGVLERVGAAISGQSADVMAQARVLKADNGRLTAELAQTKSSLESATQRIATLEQQNKDLASKDATARQGEVASAVTIELAGVGQPEKALVSSGGSQSHEDKLEDIRAQIAASTDSREKGRLAAQARALRNASN